MNGAARFPTLKHDSEDSGYPKNMPSGSTQGIMLDQRANAR